MNIVVRVDASIDTGTGHVMRCLTLADELRQSGASVSFVCREGGGNLIELIGRKGYVVHRLPAGIDLEADKRLTQRVLKEQPAPPDWLISDHYDFDVLWESPLRRFVKKIMVIDDLANRQHDCDLLLDQNFSLNETRYQELLPKHCIKLLGPKYALLRPQFREARENLKERNGEIRRILIFMGGVDAVNETCKILRAIKVLNHPDISTDVVIGVSNPYRNEVETLASRLPNTTCHFHVENMAKLLAAADFSVGAGGTTTWERCCIGLPTMVIAIAENQVETIRELSREGNVFYAGCHEDITEQDLSEDLSFFRRHPEVVRQVSLKAKELVDGRGTETVVSYLSDRLGAIRLRPAASDDCGRVFQWRNHPDTRRYAFDSFPISWDEHLRWFSKTISSSDVILLIGEIDSNPVGVLRYDLKGQKVIVSVYVVPGLSGMRIGTHLLKMGSSWIKENYPDVRKIIAEILPQNIPSIKAFQKAGFKEDNIVYAFDLNRNTP